MYSQPVRRQIDILVSLIPKTYFKKRQSTKFLLPSGSLIGSQSQFLKGLTSIRLSNQSTKPISKCLTSIIRLYNRSTNYISKGLTSIRLSNQSTNYISKGLTSIIRLSNRSTKHISKGLTSIRFSSRSSLSYNLHCSCCGYSSNKTKVNIDKIFLNTNINCIKPKKKPNLCLKINHQSFLMGTFSFPNITRVHTPDPQLNYV